MNANRIITSKFILYFYQNTWSFLYYLLVSLFDILFAKNFFVTDFFSFQLSLFFSFLFQLFLDWQTTYQISNKEILTQIWSKSVYSSIKVMRERNVNAGRPLLF